MFYLPCSGILKVIYRQIKEYLTVVTFAWRYLPNQTTTYYSNYTHNEPQCTILRSTIVNSLFGGEKRADKVIKLCLTGIM